MCRLRGKSIQKKREKGKEFIFAKELLIGRQVQGDFTHSWNLSREDKDICVQMSRNARWRSRRPRNKAADHGPDSDILVLAPELSLPIQLCRQISKGIVLHPRATVLERERECRNPVHKRQLCSGDVGYVIWRSPSNVAVATEKKRTLHMIWKKG